MRIDISHRHDEWLNAVISLKRDAASEYNCVCGLDSEVSWPEFCGLNAWSVNHKLISLKIES